ncbi:hypothetical protein KUF71_017163, partial [Frankliniella fusca]
SSIEDVSTTLHGGGTSFSSSGIISRSFGDLSNTVNKKDDHTVYISISSSTPQKSTINNFNSDEGLPDQVVNGAIKRTHVESKVKSGPCPADLEDRVVEEDNENDDSSNDGDNDKAHNSSSLLQKFIESTERLSGKCSMEQVCSSAPKNSSKSGITNAREDTMRLKYEQPGKFPSNILLSGAAKGGPTALDVNCSISNVSPDSSIYYVNQSPSPWHPPSHALSPQQSPHLKDFPSPPLAKMNQDPSPSYDSDEEVFQPKRKKDTSGIPLPPMKSNQNTETGTKRKLGRLSLKSTLKPATSQGKAFNFVVNALQGPDTSTEKKGKACKSNMEASPTKKEDDKEFCKESSHSKEECAELKWPEKAKNPIKVKDKLVDKKTAKDGTPQKSTINNLNSDDSSDLDEVVFKPKRKRVTSESLESHLTFDFRPQDLKHQPLSTQTNDYISKLLAWNVPPAKVVESLRDDSYKRANRISRKFTKLRRDNLVKKKTITERMRKKRALLRFANKDEEAVYLKVMTLLEEEYNPVLIFKPLGEKLVVGPEGSENIPEHFFVLALQTREQLEMMVDGCKEILVVDETHGTNSYGYQLLNLMVRDKFNLGYPVGHALCYPSEEVALQYVFKAIKERCPDIKINCYITDEDCKLINSVNMGFGEEVWHLLCIWHIHRTVQTNLRDRTKNNDLVTEIYGVMCVLIDEPDESEFLKLKDSFVEEYSLHLHKIFSMFEFSKPLAKVKKEPEFFSGPTETVEQHLETVEETSASNQERSVQDRIKKIREILQDFDDTYLDNSPVKRLLPCIETTLKDLQTQCKPFEKKSRKRKKAGLEKPNKKSVQEIKNFLLTEQLEDEENVDQDLAPLFELNDEQLEDEEKVDQDLASLFEMKDKLASSIGEPITDTGDPLCIILEYQGIKVLSIHLKALHPTIHSEELPRLLQADPNFVHGWLYDEVINIYLKILTDSNDYVFACDTTVAQRLCNGNYIFKNLHVKLSSRRSLRTSGYLSKPCRH